MGVYPVSAPIPTNTLSNNLVRLWHRLGRFRQRQFLMLLGLMLVSAFAETIFKHYWD